MGFCDDRTTKAAKIDAAFQLNEWSLVGVDEVAESRAQKDLT